MSGSTHRHVAFGVMWHSDLPLSHFDLATEDSTAGDAIDVRVVATLPARTALREVNGGFIHADGFRFPWRDEVIFDCRNGTRIDCMPGAGWTGVMPTAFYGTVAALTLAWRGALPCHASAVEVSARAILIAGVAGVGKSTLTAALMARGARLIGDDLTVVRSLQQSAFMASRGRPDIRLHADTAACLPATRCDPIPADERGKWLVRPVARSTCDAVPIAGIILLGAGMEASDTIERRDSAILLGPHLFRPRWLAALPDHAGRLRTMLGIANNVACVGVDPGEGFHRDPAAVDRAWHAVTRFIGQG